MANVNIMNVFITVLLVQLFFSVSINLYTYSLAGTDSLNYISSFSDVAGQVNITTVSQEVSGSLEKQSNVPIVELGALIFYSGNILMDLILNFAFAIPEMIGLVIYGIANLIALPVQMIYIIESFAAGTILILYFVSIIQLVTGLRSGRIV